VYCQMTVTTGMSISGKMSVGIDRNAVTPEIGSGEPIRKTYKVSAAQSARSP
jgi:hypothetical protein